MTPTLLLAVVLGEEGGWGGGEGETVEENGGQGEEDSVCSRAPLICNCRTVRAGETEEERCPRIKRRPGFPVKHTMTLHG